MAPQLPVVPVGLQQPLSATVQPVVALVDYGAGNLQSLANAVEHAGAEARRITRGDSLDGATHVILPGVGAFGYCAGQLRASGMLPLLEDWAITRRRPLLGICVGMQLLADSSDELGLQAGLGWIGGDVRQLTSPQPGIRIPHVGWNDVRFQGAFGDFAAGAQADFYFDHSFAFLAPRRGEVLASCEHGRTFCAAVRNGNIIGVQFHPEKSQTAGRRFLAGFLRT